MPDQSGTRVTRCLPLQLVLMLMLVLVENSILA